MSTQEQQTQELKQQPTQQSQHQDQETPGAPVTPKDNSEVADYPTASSNSNSSSNPNSNSTSETKSKSKPKSPSFNIFSAKFNLNTNTNTILLFALVLLSSLIVGAYLAHNDNNSQLIHSEIKRIKDHINHLENENQKLNFGYNYLLNIVKDQNHDISKSQHKIASLERQYQQQKSQNDQMLVQLELARLAQMSTKQATNNNILAGIGYHHPHQHQHHQQHQQQQQQHQQQPQTQSTGSGISQKEKNELKAEFEKKLKEYKESTSNALADIKTDLRDQYRRLARVDDQTRLNFESIENLETGLNTLSRKLGLSN